MKFRPELEVLLSREKQYCNMSHVKQPLQKLEKSLKTLTLYLLMMFLSFLALLFLVLPYMMNNVWTWLIVGWFCLTNLCFLGSWVRNPGFLQKSDKVSFVKLVEKFDPNMLCPTCEVICTVDSRHCYICNRCVERFDHHCQWINNCVGVNNHGFFFFFILTLEIYFILIDIMGITHIDMPFDSTDYVTALESSSYFLPTNIFNLSYSQIQLAYQVVLITVLLVATFFLIPLSFLVFI
mmetsp:Transcript_16093/g.11608  ORF Transcript_16093/g.11608 Transcript_16093/m.11608 type:complete len:237 (+) Transcript_16093:1048-1758(+)